MAMNARKMLRLGIALICLALVLEVLPSITPSSFWLSTRWFEHSIDARTGELVPVPYRAPRGGPSSQELTEMARKYRILTGDVREMVSVRDLLAQGASSEYGQAVWKRWPNLAGRLGFFQIVDARAKTLRRIGGLIFLGGLAFLFGALYHTYQAEKDIPSLNLP
jgi:hypothetical protein